MPKWLSFLVFSLLLKLRTLFFSYNGNGLLANIILSSFSDFGTFWHEYEIVDNGNLLSNNSLLVGYHSRCTLDLFYLVSVLRPKVVVSHMIFTVSFIGQIFSLCGAIPSKGGCRNSVAEVDFVDALCKGEKPLLVLPGGLTEFGKDIKDRFKVKWLREPGFARLIHDHPSQLGLRTRVIPFYTANCERIFWNNDYWHDFCGNRVQFLMDEVRRGRLILLPILLTFGLFSVGCFLLPMPVKLTTNFGKEVCYRPGESVAAFADRVANELNALIARCEKTPPTLRKTGVRDVLTRIIVATYVIVQNLAIAVLVLCLIFLVVPISLAVEGVSTKSYSRNTMDKNR